MQKLSYTTEQQRGSCCTCLVSSVHSERLLGQDWRSGFLEARIFAHIYIAPRSLAVVPPGRRKAASSETEQNGLDCLWESSGPFGRNSSGCLLAPGCLSRPSSAARPPVAPAPVRCPACPSRRRRWAPSQAQARPLVLTLCSHRREGRGAASRSAAGDPPWTLQCPLARLTRACRRPSPPWLLRFHPAARSACTQTSHARTRGSTGPVSPPLPPTLLPFASYPLHCGFPPPSPSVPYWTKPRLCRQPPAMDSLP